MGDGELTRISEFLFAYRAIYPEFHGFLILLEVKVWRSITATAAAPSWMLKQVGCSSFASVSCLFCFLFSFSTEDLVRGYRLSSSPLFRPF